ncbi:MAG TPA: DMT family protein [Bacteroidia bacterium]
MRGVYSILLLIGSNVFMTYAWYGHLKFKDYKFFENKGLMFFILISWAIAFFEYCLQVPANRIGHESSGGPFSMMQLKIIQEVISLLVFVVFSIIVFKEETIKWNHYAAIVCIIGAVYFVFKK